VGFALESVVLDEKGRVKIPREVLNELGLAPGQLLVLEVRNGTIVLRPKIGLEEFVSELRGCVKGSKIKPNELKGIWRM